MREKRRGEGAFTCLFFAPTVRMSARARPPFERTHAANRRSVVGEHLPGANQLRQGRIEPLHREHLLLQCTHCVFEFHFDIEQFIRQGLQLVHGHS